MLKDSHPKIGMRKRFIAGKQFSWEKQDGEKEQVLYFAPLNPT